MDGLVIIDQFSPVSDVLKALPQDEIDELSAVGDTRDMARWTIGRMVMFWIDTRQMPATAVYQIAANLTDYKTDRVRQFCSVARFYAERPELVERYEVLRFSIFEHASKCGDPEEALKAALEGQLSPTVVKNTTPALMDELTQIYRRVSKAHAKEARSIIETARAKLMELIE